MSFWSSRSAADIILVDISELILGVAQLRSTIEKSGIAKRDLHRLNSIQGILTTMERERSISTHTMIV